MRRMHVIGFVGGLSLVVFALWLFRPARPESSGIEPARAVVTPTAPADAVTRAASDDPAVPPRRARPSARLELTEAQQELVNAVQGHERLAKISPVSIQAYLDQCRRSAGSLLTAYQATGDPAYLSEAVAEFPDEPRVQYAMAIRPDQPPAEKRQWLERFKAAAPDNALPAYLSAREHFRQGLTDTAVTELRLATTRPGFSPYVFESMIDTQELLMADGASPAAAKVGSMFSASFPHLSQMRQLASDISRSQVQSAQAGDLVTFDAMTQMGWALAERMNASNSGQFLIDQLVGMAVEQLVWKNVDPASAPDYLGMTVQQRLDELAELKVTIKTLAPLAETHLPTASENELIMYLERVKLMGELEALRWLQRRYE